MEVTGGAEEGFVREWTPCTHILSLIPPRIQSGLFSNELCLTCVDVISEYIALGTNVGLVYWYDRKKGTIQRLRCEASSSPITYVKIVNTVDYMVGAGNAAGQVTVFQIPKEHPENVPDTFKPKVEPKVERYTIGDLHKSKITSIEWSKNGMRLFSGDKNGVIIMTEIDFYMHLCKSTEIVNEEHEIVQMSYYQNTLLVSSLYRSIECERRDGKWHINQIGKKERKSLCALGATVAYSYARGGGGAAMCYSARPGLRLWRCPPGARVQHTLLFKEAIANPLTVVELLNPSQQKHEHSERRHNLGPLQMFREHFLVSHNEWFLYILDPRSCTAVAVIDDLRKILSVSVHKDEIFVLEGPRSLIRLAPAPESPTLHSDDPLNLMTKSLTSSLQQAVNTMKDLTHLDQTVPYIASVLEQPMALLNNHELLVSNAEECFELPPIKSLPGDISNNVLESIINEFKDVSSEAEEIRRMKSEELQRKLKLYNSIMEREQEGELIHSSRRSRRREPGGGGSGGGSPRPATPARRLPDVSYTSPCLMNVSVYGNLPPENDDLLEQEIEEKEKILAKMLNLESLSIKTAFSDETDLSRNQDDAPTYQQNEQPVTLKTEEKVIEKVISKKVPKHPKIDIKTIDLMPKIVQLPNTWNLENIELKLDEKSNGFADARTIASPDDHVESEWEFI